LPLWAKEARMPVRETNQKKKKPSRGERLRQGRQGSAGGHLAAGAIPVQNFLKENREVAVGPKGRQKYEDWTWTLSN